MRGSLRVHSVLELTRFLGWSLLVSARERLAPARPPQHLPRAPVARRAPEDRLRWN